jgi:hypothetical protein
MNDEWDEFRRELRAAGYVARLEANILAEKVAARARARNEQMRELSSGDPRDLVGFYEKTKKMGIDPANFVGAIGPKLSLEAKIAQREKLLGRKLSEGEQFGEFFGDIKSNVQDAVRFIRENVFSRGGRRPSREEVEGFRREILSELEKFEK